MISSINIHSGGASYSSGGIILGTNSNTTITTTSGSNLVYSSGSGAFSILSYNSKYHILGEDYEVKGSHVDPNLAIVISTLNVLKRPFWEQIKKQSIKFDNDLENFIEERLKIYDRDEKLESLLPNQS